MDKKRIYKSRGFRRVSVIFLCVVLLLSGVYGNASTIQEMENKISALEQEKDEINGKLDKLRDDESRKVEYQATLQEKVQLVETQINQTRQDIEELDKQIVELETTLKKAEEEISETLTMFYDRVKTLYKSGSGNSLSTLQVLMDSESLHEFSIKSEMLKSVSKHDQQIMDRIQVYMDETAEEREAVARNKAEVAKKKVALEANQKELDDLYRENKKEIQELQDMQADAAQRKEEIEATKGAYISELENLIAEQKAEEERKRVEREKQQQAQSSASSGGGSSGGGGGSGNETISPSSGGSGSFSNLAWPMPGVYYVSQHYNGAGHYGIDIAGPSGTPIVAVDSGEVIRSNGSDWWGMGWGYHVLIYHNDTYSTLSAHMSSVAVSNGEYVSKGQTIGYEGSTGWSTGPHLHFEIYQNGSLVNPWPFIGG